MLPSLTEYFRTRFSPSDSIGINLGRNKIEMLRVRRNSKTFIKYNAMAEKIETPLFSGNVSKDVAEILTNVLAEMLRDIRDMYIPVHISLPDPAVHIASFELKEIPSKKVARNELMEWLMASKFGLQGIDCISQSMGRNGMHHLQLGIALDSQWHNMITGALMRAGINAWSMNASCLYQFNYFHNLIAQKAGMLLILTNDYWSILLWNDSGRITYSRAGWISESLSENDIVSEIERSVLGYVHGATDRFVNDIYLIEQTDRDNIRRRLNSRLTKPMVVLKYPEIASDTCNTVNMSNLSMLAGVVHGL